MEGAPSHVFVQGDICDKELIANLFKKCDFDFDINFAAESHVDKSIAKPEIFVQTNVMGTVNLLQWITVRLRHPTRCPEDSERQST